MRRTASEKMEIIKLVEDSDLSVRRTLEELDLPRSTFYDWYRRYTDEGYDGLIDKKPTRATQWNVIPEHVRKNIVQIALERMDLSPRELACHFTDEHHYFVSESSVYRILKAHDLITRPSYILLSASDAFKNPTRQINELWQTDFTYLRVTGWGWYYLSTVMDDFSRYIIAWKLSKTMAASDVVDTLDAALGKSGVEQVSVYHRPRLLSDNGPAYLSKELHTYLDAHGMTHTRGAPYHPMTQGKIERYHRSMKNVVKLENDSLPWQLERQIEHFVEYYNNERYHESLNNVTPADVYYGRNHEILSRREKIKRLTLRKRKQENQVA